MNIGSLIKKLREKKDINQVFLANKLGVTQTYLSLIESNKKTPSNKLIISFSKELDVPAPILAYLTFKDEDLSSDKLEAYKQMNPIIEDLITKLLIEDENI